MSADEILGGYDADATLGVAESGVAVAAETPVRYGAELRGDVGADGGIVLSEK